MFPHRAVEAHRHSSYITTFELCLPKPSDSKMFPSRIEVLCCSEDQSLIAVGHPKAVQIDLLSLSGREHKVSAPSLMYVGQQKPCPDIILRLKGFFETHFFCFRGWDDRCLQEA